MGDLNAKVGDERYQNIIGMHGFGRRNERGERLIQFCQKNKLIIANTWFQQPVRKLCTWKSPGDISRNQIDYIMLNERFRNCIKQAKWVEYITKLYEDHREQMPKSEVTSGASLMKEEIRKALKSMKDGKATGTNELPAEKH